MSEDNTYFEHSNLMNENNGSIDDLELLVDANDLRRRLKKIENSVSRSYSRQHSPSRRYLRFKSTNKVEFCYRQ